MEHSQLDTSNVVTIFFQGNRESRAQATHYCGKEGLDIYVSEGNVEHVFSPNTPQLLYNLFLFSELNDIEFGFSWNPFHWISMLFHQFYSWYFNLYGTACMPHNKWSLMNIAGPEDVAQCVIAIRACIKKHPYKRLVLFGCSRGASTVLVALTQLDKEELTHLAFVIAEAPFASVPSLLTEYNTTLAPYILSLLERFTLFNRDQYSPLDAVKSERFPTHIPLLMITSDADTTVPLKNTTHLLDVLWKERNHMKCSHTRLKESYHGMMPLQSTADITAYSEALERYYKQYL